MGGVGWCASSDMADSWLGVGVTSTIAVLSSAAFAADFREVRALALQWTAVRAARWVPACLACRLAMESCAAAALNVAARLVRGVERTTSCVMEVAIRDALMQKVPACMPPSARLHSWYPWWSALPDLVLLPAPTLFLGATSVQLLLFPIAHSAHCAS